MFAGDCHNYIDNYQRPECVSVLVCVRACVRACVRVILYEHVCHTINKTSVFFKKSEASTGGKDFK